MFDKGTYVGRRFGAFLQFKLYQCKVQRAVFVIHENVVQQFIYSQIYFL